MTTLVILALAGESLVLFDFEREHDLRAWETNGERCELRLVGEHATSGRRALRLVVREGEEWPSIHTERVPRDWTGYECLRADVHNPQEHHIPFFVRLGDAESHDGRSSYIKRLSLTPGRNAIEVKLFGLATLDERREIRLDTVRNLSFFCGREVRIGTTLYIDNVRLEKTDRPAVSRRRGPTPLARGAAVITLTTGRKFIGKILEADEKKVRVRTAFASLELKRSQIKSIEGPGGAPVARAREHVDFFASIPVDGSEARGIQKRNLKFAGGFHKEGKVSGRAVRGLRCGEKFVLVLDAEGRELAFCVPFRAVGEYPRRSIYDPNAVRGVKRVRPGQEVEFDWNNGGNGWLWMEAPEWEGDLPEDIEEILEGLGGRDWRNSIGRLAAQVDPREAALELSDIVDSNRGANVALEVLSEVLRRLPADEVPEEVATSLVFGLFHPYDNGIRVKCARVLGALRLREAESALRDCVAVRPTPRDGAAFEKHKQELHQAVAEALKRIRSAPGRGKPAAAARAGGFVPVRKEGEIRFWISDHEVTNAEYKRFVDSTDRHSPHEADWGEAVWDGHGFPRGMDDHPVVCVSWHDAVAYCRWLTENERRARKIGENEVYRLPTAAEWEYACFGPERRRYPWGNEWDAELVNAHDEGKRDGHVDGFAGTAPARSFPGGRSWCGCYQMLGNVWEWTFDKATRGDRPARVLLGGSWYDRVGPAAKNRHSRRPGHRRNDMGFRPVRARGGPAPGNAR